MAQMAKKMEKVIFTSCQADRRGRKANHVKYDESLGLRAFQSHACGST